MDKGMSKEKINQIIDEAYENYLFNSEWFPISSVSGGFTGTKATGEIMTENLFINKIKTDSEFSEKWGLKIEEQELVVEERVKWAYDRKLIDYVTMVENKILDDLNIPTKLITITYKEKTIESYE